MELTYEDVVRILAVVDTARGEDVTLDIGGRRITVSSWRSQAATSAAAPEPSRNEPAPVARPPDLVDVRSTELGYFHRLRKLGIGTWVNEGDTLGEIVGLPAAPAKPVRAPASGRIVDLCLDEDGFVEYGQVLLMLDVAAASSAGDASPEASDRRVHAGRATAKP